MDPTDRTDDGGNKSNLRNPLHESYGERHLRYGSEVSEATANHNAPINRDTSEPSTVTESRFAKKPYLKSIYQVFFKLKYYGTMNIPFNKCSKIVFGNATTHPDQRFFLFFYDYECCYTICLAILVYAAHCTFLVNVIKEVSADCIAINNSALYFAILMCSLYAGNVATESFVSYLPFEAFGQTEQSLLQYWSEKMERHGGEKISFARMKLADAMFQTRTTKLTDTFSFLKETSFSTIDGVVSGGGDLLSMSMPTVSLEQVQAKASTFVVWVGVGAFLLTTILLLVSVGIILSSYNTYVELVQNFIAVEIVTHVHELIPHALQIHDPAPEYRTKPWVDVVTELEDTGLLPVGWIVRKSEGKPGLYRQSVRIYYKRLFVFYVLFVWAIYFAGSAFCGNISA